MKNLLILLLAGGLIRTADQGPASGTIQYEVTQKVDPSQMRVVINGQEVKPGSPDFPADIPDSRTFGMTLAFAGPYAREERQNGALRTIVDGGPGSVPQTTSVGRPFEEAVYVDQAGRTFSQVMTVKKDGTTTVYRADTPFARPTDWKETDQTRKIAGFTCHKAAVPFHKETYTVWYTTELPFTYSPIRELVPEKGVVLAIEGSREQYRATKVDAKAVAESTLRPTQPTQSVTAAQLKDLREKAMADFRQKMMEREGAPGRGQ